VRVALVTNIVAPYRVPVFRRLAETPGWQLRIFTSAETEFDRSWSVDTGDLDVVVVPGLSHVVGGRRTVHLPLGLPLALRRFRPDAVVSAELGARSWLAWLACGCAGCACALTLTSVSVSTNHHRDMTSSMLKQPACHPQVPVRGQSNSIKVG